MFEVLKGFTQMQTQFESADVSYRGPLTPSKPRSVPSLIKWTGSKRSQAAAIFQLLPSYNRYFEPFLGGGAILFGAATQGSIAGDIYRPLIELWKLIQQSPTKVINRYRAQWTELNRELDGLRPSDLSRSEAIPRYFYKVRERFNRTKDPLDLNFIMRTCVNGIVRFNAGGEFNNSFHLSRRGMEPERFSKIAWTWHRAIEGIEFVCQDYALTLNSTKRGDFVYLDPPYAGNKQRYADDLDLNRFFDMLERLNKKGVAWALSFDGHRGDTKLVHDVPKCLYRRHLLLSSGNSAVNKVLNGPVEEVRESLYLNY